VGPESATLNARGTADNGSAHSDFEYWPTGSTEYPSSAPGGDWPAGASGPFSAKVTGLAANTSYSFRVCGYDVGSTSRACAQTRTFKTAPPVEDGVIGWWNLSPHRLGVVDAHSGPSGQNPRGYLEDVNAPFTYSSFKGFVTCLAVGGNRAAVGAVGQERLEDGQMQPATLVVTIVDGGPTGSDTIGRQQASGSTPPNCAAASFSQQVDFGSAAKVVVNDAP
jgi:hypothetical protein